MLVSVQLLDTHALVDAPVVVDQAIPVVPVVWYIVVDQAGCGCQGRKMTPGASSRVGPSDGRSNPSMVSVTSVVPLSRPASPGA